MRKIDARGLSCPEPVLRARQEIEKLAGDELLEVLVDTVTSRENVFRAARYLGCGVEVKQLDGNYLVCIEKKVSS